MADEPKMHVALIEIRWAGGPHAAIKDAIENAVDDFFEGKLMDVTAKHKAQFEAVSLIRFFIDDGRHVV